MAVEIVSHDTAIGTPRGAEGAIALVVDPGGHPIGMYSRTPLPATNAKPK